MLPRSTARLGSSSAARRQAYDIGTSRAGSEAIVRTLRGRNASHAPPGPAIGSASDRVRVRGLHGVACDAFDGLDLVCPGPDHVVGRLLHRDGDAVGRFDTSPAVSSTVSRTHAGSSTSQSARAFAGEKRTQDSVSGSTGPPRRGRYGIHVMRDGHHRPSFRITRRARPRHRCPAPCAVRVTTRVGHRRASHPGPPGSTPVRTAPRGI